MSMTQKNNFLFQANKTQSPALFLDAGLTDYVYKNQKAVMATKHEKEEMIAPAFMDLLGLRIVKANIDTDQLGTFSGEVDRQDSPLVCARKKCELAIKEYKVPLAISSEGSFGPHPFIPFITCDYEILYFIDKLRGFEIHESLISENTNYKKEAFSDYQQLKRFCEETIFPSHALIVKPNYSIDKSMTIKGIKTFDLLEESFKKCCKLSHDGKALVQTDMRANMNPTRMGVIRELADTLAHRLARTCPSCSNPGWGLVDTRKGLQCELCAHETDVVKSEIFGCPKCLFRQINPRRDGLVLAEARYCNLCNP